MNPPSPRDSSKHGRFMYAEQLLIVVKIQYKSLRICKDVKTREPLPFVCGQLVIVCPIASGEQIFPTKDFVCVLWGSGTDFEQRDDAICLALGIERIRKKAGR